MKAIVYNAYGSPDVLHVQEVDKPSPGPADLLIRVHAAEATKADCELRRFRFPVKWFWLPLRLAFGVRRPRRTILGGYFSGVIETVGTEVTGYAPGDEVFGSAGMGMGAYGQYVKVPATATLAKKPPSVSFEAAAAVPLGGLNALHFMRRAAIRPGERVLINGAAGSIGAFAVQIAKQMGAEVTAVDADYKEAMVRGIGADHFVDYRTEDFTQSGQTYDVVFDMVVSSSYGACLRCLSPGGRYVLGNPRLSDMLRSVLTSTFTNKDVIFAFAGEKPEELEDLADMLARGELEVPIDRVLSLEEAPEAHRRVETEERIGAVVLSHDLS
ncbi:MAG: NAD(P)-dependent alcohol dehydrogenase [Deltaproteobacteria bacterium]|nr:NAD(P)-dependent alcohol dehydrogenase [Deltaproteobacteria bacterium]